MAGYRRPVSDAERAAAADSRQATLDQLHGQLSDGVLALNGPQAWQAWLKFASRFHKYSFGNSLLIMVQDPQATHVAGWALNAVTEPVLPLADTPLIIEDLLVRAKQMADADAGREAIDEILDHVAALREGRG